jgi:sulfur carrier protein ThiS adenylyltransferase
MTTEQQNERYSRQKDIVPAERLAVCKATVIGVGAIGRQVALQLTALGIPWLQLIDPDTVDTSNLASQGYFEKDLHTFKVEATTLLCKQINSNVEFDWIKHPFRRSINIGT